MEQTAHRFPEFNLNIFSQILSLWYHLKTLKYVVNKDAFSKILFDVAIKIPILEK
jgi:hypothetical protein